MLLIATATEREMAPFRNLLADHKNWQALITGVGILESAATLNKFLRRNDTTVSRVINFGVAGAFLDTGVDILDICLATGEFLADLGICLGDDVLPLACTRNSEIPTDGDFLAQAEFTLSDAKIPYHSGTFITVNSVSGTAARGNNLRDRYGAICENMEGAAIIKACRDFSLPCLEFRCVSNLVEDRDLSHWQLDEAIAKGAETLVPIINNSRPEN